MARFSSPLILGLALLVLSLGLADASGAERRAHLRRGADDAALSSGAGGEEKGDEEGDVGDDDDDKEDDNDKDDKDEKDGEKANNSASQEDEEDDEDEESQKSKEASAIEAAEKTIAENDAKRKKLEEEIKGLQDEDGFHAEVDKAVKKVSNETQTVHMANFLGEMWKEMRMYSAPFYVEHLENETMTLARENKKLASKIKNLKQEENEDQEEDKREGKDKDKKAEAKGEEKEKTEAKDVFLEEKAASGLSCAASSYENEDFSRGEPGTCRGCLVPTNSGGGLPLCHYRESHGKEACDASEGKVWCGTSLLQEPAE